MVTGNVVVPPRTMDAVVWDEVTVMELGVTGSLPSLQAAVKVRAASSRGSAERIMFLFQGESVGEQHAHQQAPHRP
jgi:hypothetical protein